MRVNGVYPRAHRALRERQELLEWCLERRLQSTTETRTPTSSSSFPVNRSTLTVVPVDVLTGPADPHPPSSCGCPIPPLPSTSIPSPPRPDPRSMGRPHSPPRSLVYPGVRTASSYLGSKVTRHPGLFLSHSVPPSDPRYTVGLSPSTPTRRVIFRPRGVEPEVRVLPSTSSFRFSLPDRRVTVVLETRLGRVTVPGDR